MDSDIEELESLFSEHFGRTPTATPFASQSSTTFDEDLDLLNDDVDEDEDDDPAPSVDVDEQARLFTLTENSDDEDADRDYILVDGDADVQRVRQFVITGCGCNNNCHQKFKERDVYKHILDVREMDKTDREMYIMATLIGSTESEVTKRGKKRQRSRYKYFFLGKEVCKRMFQLVFDIGKHCLQNILTHINQHGATPRTHGNIGRKPANAVKFEDIKLVVQFISNFADEFGLPQPAAPRGRDNVAPIYLTSDSTKLCIHQKYADVCLSTSPETRVLKYSTFCNIWNTCLPHIKIATPRDDVCATCEKMRKAILDSVTENEKLQTTIEMKNHIETAQKEREVYNACIKLAKESYTNQEAELYVHYTFDFSQNVCVPHHSRQMGPMYFTSLRKVQIFGFRIDGIPKQLNFLIDENETIGKDGSCAHGPNSVISMIHCALQSNSSGETACTIHADNCPGQNKNQFVLGYFMWRVMTNRHSKIEYLMQVPGHARCLVDSGFASLKKLYRRTDCDTLDQLEAIVNRSSTTNVAVRYPSWTCFDWKSFLRPVFRPLKGIRQYQSFTMSSSEPGLIRVKKSFDDEEISVNILKNHAFVFDPESMPASIIPEGLSHDRAVYLHRQVRQFVRPAYQDVTCPVPTD